MAEYRLYCDSISGNAYKVGLMLSLSGCDWEAVAVDYLAGTTRTPDYRAEINEMGEIPVLVHGERRLSQSGAILTYLAERTGRFAPADEEGRYETLRWLLFDNHKFTSYFATLRFLVGIQKTGETPVTEFLRGRVETAFGIVDRHLATRDFMVGAGPTIADVSMCAYLFYPEETGIDVPARFPSITAWLGRIAALPGWRPPYEMLPGGKRG